MRYSSTRPAILTAIIIFAAAGIAGCAAQPSAREIQALDLASQARQQALLISPSPQQQQLVEHLDQLVKTLADDTATNTEIIAATRWYEQFRPVKVSVSYFTEVRDFSGDGNIDGLDVRVTLEDRFGDAVKALGDFRVELFSHLPRSNDPRGGQISNWFVSVNSAEDLEKYWDSTDRAFRFPLALSRTVQARRAIVQVTYYVPDGSGKMLFGERVIRIGQ